jgi:FkbH-like protein
VADQLREKAVPPSHRAIAATLAAHRAAIIAALAAGTHSGAPRENRFHDDPDQFARRIGTWVDLLIGHVEGRPGYDALLASQTLLENHRPEWEAAENRAVTIASLDAVWAELAGAGGLDAAALAELKAVFDDVTLGLRTEPRAHVRTLLLGDCLMGEIGGLAADMLARSAISFDAFPFNGRDPADFERQIGRLPNQNFDAVFFSPFSHARTAEIDALLDPRRALEGGKTLDALIEAVIAATRAQLAYMIGRFECPIYVHDAALIGRATTAAKGLIRNGLTARRRSKARARINAWLEGFVADRNAVGARRLHIVSETAILDRLGQAAGRYLYNSDYQHATELSFALARDYARRIEMLATLKGRKLVVCDLDHTLWDGVIGEGAVRHYSDRQQALRRLKEKSGVVLTIASKNDPDKVHFAGGVLAIEDFVAPQISWGRKVEAVERLRQQLNLQVRHMVFVDDRPDERAFMADAYPEMLVLDATDPETWARIALWADATEGSSDLDRTQLYQEQLERDAFVGDGTISQLSEDVIADLQLKIAVREASKGDLKRFTELINRTNQWNMTGARTSLATVKDQAEAADALLLLARASDKFGDMGDVCATTVTIAGEAATIDAFVLSCRVFGYGVETAMLDAIREKAKARGATRLSARFVPTTQNHMARDMYLDHGFAAKAEGLFAVEL